MYCTQCGKKLIDTAVFCPMCGHKMMTMKELEAMQVRQKPTAKKYFGLSISKW